MANRSQLLFDVVTRQQIYVEGLKEHQTAKAQAVFAAMVLEVRAAIDGLTVENVGELTQRQINALIKRLRQILTEGYNRLVAEFVNFLTDWLVYERNTFPEMLADDDNPVVLLPAATLLWKDIRNAPMAITGKPLLDMLALLGISAKDKLESRIRGGVVDNMALREFRASIVGTPGLNFRDGIINGLRNDLGAALATTMQHGLSQLRDAAYGLLTDRYMWNSVIDKATTDVCRRRNGRTFIRGRGPVPPAHYRCRSSTVPVFLRQPLTLPNNYVEWLTGQPEPFINDILPGRIAAALKRGELRSGDLPAFSDPAPLTLDQYRNKSRLIRTGTEQ